MTQTKTKTKPWDKSAFATSANKAIDGLRLASTAIAIYITSNDLDAVDNEALTLSVEKLSVQIFGLVMAKVDDSMEIRLKKQLLKDALGSIALCKKFMHVA